MKNTAFIKTKELTKSYASGRIKVTALNKVSFKVKKGQFIGVTGPSGSGKSTLLNLLGGLDSPTSGEIIINNKSISKKNNKELAEYRRYSVGMVFQSFNLIPSLSAAENVALPLFFSGINKKQRLKKANKVLGEVGLSKRILHKPSELSGGEKQRVAIARAMINNPLILLADEPTGNLDSKTSLEILNLITELNKKGITIILVSHEKPLLKKFSETIIHLIDGKIIKKT